MKRFINKLLLDTLVALRYVLSDKLYIKLYFYLRMGYRLNLDNPETMNEKLQWLKLYNRMPEYTTMVDKYEAKKYVANIIGEEYIIPTLGCWDRAEDIDFDKLPNQFVLKCTHNSGNVIICNDKSQMNKPQVLKLLKKELSRNYFSYNREWPYKNIKPRIIAEKLMTDNTNLGLNDYKFYCFDGFVDSVMICIDRHLGSPKFYFFDKEWNLKRYNKRGKEAADNFSLPKPPNIEKMFNIASRLSDGIPFVRIDLYNIEGRIYFGEATFFPSSGCDRNRLKESDIYFGQLIKLPNK